MGADLVAFSGGKAIRGPQSTGILCGRRDLVAAAALQMLDLDDHFELWNPPAELIDKALLKGLPRHGIGRALKVSKEEIVALLTALRLFVEGQDASRPDLMHRLLAKISSSLQGMPLQSLIQTIPDGESYPILEICINERAIGRSAFDVCRRLRNGRPAIYVGHGLLSQGKLVINPLHLYEANSSILAQRLREELGPRQ
jgi:L-seryl-tRNA(Ser) seleniumtransferase